jgi:hypothetical protein
MNKQLCSPQILVKKIPSHLVVSFTICLLSFSNFSSAQFAATFVDDDFVAPVAPNYNSIQDAIDNTDPGGTVTVAAGVYLEIPTSGVPLITIPASKTGLRLIGPQADVDPRPIAGTSRTMDSIEAVIEGNGSASPTHQLINIEASDVEINGFTIRSENVDLIVSPDPGNTSGIILRYNKVSDSGDEAIQLRDTEGALIEYNYIHTTDGDGLSVCCGSSKAVIQYNEIANIDTTNGAIYLYSPPASGLEALIYRNLIRDVTSHTGIYMGINGGGDANVGGTAGWIIENTLHTIHHDGIEVLADNLLIQGNEIYNIAPTSSSPYGGIAFREDVNNTQIVNNTIRDSAFNNAASGGIYMASGVLWTGISASNNNFTNNTPRAINNLTTGTLPAPMNWWNASDGPDDDAMVINGSGDVISTDVDATGFLTGAETIDTPGSTIPEDPVSYGTIAENTTSDMDISITNPSTLASLVVTSPGLTITGPDASQFEVVGSTGLPLIIAPGATASNALTIRYSSGPTPLASHMATGTLVGTDTTPATVALDGSALPVELSIFSLD